MFDRAFSLPLDKQDSLFVFGPRGTGKTNWLTTHLSENENAGLALETLFYQSLLALIDYQKLDAQIYYWKTAAGLEVDFVFYGAEQLIAFEIKHAKNITPTMLRGLRHFKEDYPMASLCILYLGDDILHLADGILAVPFIDGLKQLPNWISENISYD